VFEGYNYTYNFYLEAFDMDKYIPEEVLDEIAKLTEE
jgi:hypothetical protein